MDVPGKEWIIQGSNPAEGHYNLVNEAVRNLFWASLAPETRKMYHRALQDLASFLGFSNIEEVTIPFSHTDILRHVGFLLNSNFSYPSILSLLCSVAFWIKIKNWPLVTHSHMCLGRGLGTGSAAPVTTLPCYTPIFSASYA